MTHLFRIVGLCLVCLTIGALITTSESRFAQVSHFTPVIPKTWLDADVSTMELPLAAPAPRTSNISEAYYYSIPTATIYKSYPLTSSDRPFPEYLEWLKQ